MRMVQISTVHWGLLPTGDVRIGRVTLLGGESGSGKSSLIDAMIAVMTGNETRFARYNSGQTESQSYKKTKRSLGSYILGFDDSGPPHRQSGAHGYVAISWEPDNSDEGPVQPFTAIIGAEVRPDRIGDQVVARVHEEVRLLVFGQNISARDLLETLDSEQVIPVQDLLLALRRAYGKDSVRDFNTKGEFVTRLYASLKGLASPVDRREAESCMRAFVNSIAYRPPEDMDGLIREEILEADDNSAMIETLKTTITDIANLRQDADRLANNVERLEDVRNEVRSTIKDLVEEWMFAHLAAGWLYRDAISKQNAERVKIEEAKREADAFQDKISGLDRLIAARKDTLRRLENQLSESRVYKVRVELETRISLGEQEIEQFGDRLKGAGLKLAAMRKAVIEASRNMSGIEALADVVAKLEEARERLAATDIPTLDGHFLAARDGLGGANPGLVLREAIGILDRAIGAGWLSEFGENAAIWQTITDAMDQFRVTRKETHDVREIKRVRLGQLRLGRVPYPVETTNFLSYLRDVLPECNPRILCDVIEMRDPTWQSAIEGFIGSDRYSIIYDPSFESRVISMLRRYIPGGRTRKPSVAQLGEALKAGADVLRGSLVEKLKSDDGVALGFLKARYGRSICVATEQELMGLRSGLLRDGVSVHAFQYRNRGLPEDELVFGAEVRRRQAQLLEEQIKIADGEITELDERASRVREAYGALRRVKHEESLDTLDVARLVETGTTVKSLRIELQQLDDSDVRELERDIAGEEKAILKAEQDKWHLHEKQVTASNRANTAAAKAEELDAEIVKFKPEMLRTERNWREVLETVAKLKQPPYDASFQEELESGRPLKSFLDRRAERRFEVGNGKNEIERMIRDYNRDARPFQQVTLHSMNYGSTSQSGRAMGEWLHIMEEQIHRQLQVQRDTGLVEKRDQLQLAEDRFTTAFTTNFCARILNKVDGRDSTYEQINQALSSISFSGDRLTMVQSVKNEYSSYLELFRVIKASSDAGAPGLLSDGGQFTGEQKATLEELQTLLLSDDVEYSMKELARIADHRNYKRYDFNRSAKGGEHKSMSTWGTGSGGETETPYYIIRAAVFAAAFKLFGHQKTAHFRTMILDEVFKTMDETRKRRVLTFLTEDMGLQVICAAPTMSMAALLDSFDKRVSFAKSSEPRSLTWIDEVDIDQERVRSIYEDHRRNTAESVTAEFERSQGAGGIAEAVAAE